MIDQTELIADDLLDRFERWCADHGVEADLFFVDAALDRFVEQDLDPARWTVEDISDLLLHWFPRNVTLDHAGRPAVLSTFHHWIDFLSTTPVGRIRDADALHAEIDRHAEAFFAAMSDERNFGLAKFWAARMLEHGVDPEDGDQVREFLDGVNAGQIDYDRDVLDEIVRRRTESEEEPPEPLPPVVLPPQEEIEALAANTAVVHRLRTLTEWVGTGRALTQTNRLRVADARELAALLDVDRTAERVRSSADLPEVTLLVAWAKAVRLVRVLKGRLVAVKSAAGLLRRPWALWRQAYDAFPHLGPAVCLPANRYDQPWLGHLLPELAPDLWLALYRAGRTPLPVELLVQYVQETLGGPGGFASALMWRRELDGILAALEVLGAVEITKSTLRDLDKIAEVSGLGNPDDRLVQLTPLGLWAARQVALAEGIPAPLAHDLAGLSPERLCEALNHADREVAGIAMREWIRARTPTGAAVELASFCERTQSPSQRVLVWDGLELAGDDGIREAERLRAGGGVVGASAAQWLVRQGALDARVVDEQEMVLALAENLAALHEQGLLVAELTQHSPDDQIGIVRGLAAGDHPGRGDMLAEIVAHHPVPEIAAEAKRAV
ncbi:hypothetical protein [Amycolatopsis tucumanensis]|uniref:hypothetical protein n=1 Tax=Amycolatopsis tucumanensis TaxID=401106 RepID=UPI003D756477